MAFSWASITLMASSRRSIRSGRPKGASQAIRNLIHQHEANGQREQNALGQCLAVNDLRIELRAYG